MEETSKAALDEIRATVGVLRDAQDGDRSMKPAPGLSDLPALVDQFVSAGMEIEVRTVGSVRPLGPAVDLTAYRIIQEALVNASKHALPGAVTVSLSYEAEVLVLTVENSGTAVPSTSPPGYGLLGMKERGSGNGRRSVSRIPRGRGISCGRATSACASVERFSAWGIAVTVRVVVADDQALFRQNACTAHRF